MELTLFFLLFFVSIVTAIGVTAAIVVLVLWTCMVTVWRDVPCDGRAGWFVPGSRDMRLLHWLARWFKHTVILPPEPLPPGPLLYAGQPHGVLAASAVFTFLTGCADRPGHKPVLLAVHRVLFKIPLFREFILMLGCIDASRESILAALQHGYSVAVLPGGIREMGPPLLAMPRILGVVRLAHDFSVPLVKVVFDGEDELCWTWRSEPVLVKELRRRSAAWLGFFFPLPFLLKVWGAPPLTTRIGSALIPTKEVSLEVFNQRYIES